MLGRTHRIQQQANLITYFCVFSKCKVFRHRQISGTLPVPPSGESCDGPASGQAARSRPRPFYPRAKRRVSSQPVQSLKRITLDFVIVQPGGTTVVAKAFRAGDREGPRGVRAQPGSPPQIVAARVVGRDIKQL
jgi:hypothetical protein